MGQKGGRDGACVLWINVDWAWLEGFIEEAGLAKIGFDFHRNICLVLNQEFVHIDENFRLSSQFSSDDNLLGLALENRHIASPNCKKGN